MLARKLLLIALCLVGLSILWPVHAWLGSAKPLVFGLPLSIFWMILCIFASFFSLLAFYLWQNRNEANPNEGKTPAP